jgi:phosphoribosylformylglycinamidine cyclo-ligase
VSKKKCSSAYAQAGVDIDAMNEALRRSKRMIDATATPDVLSKTGSFGGLHRAPGRDSILVSSIDGVGTKLKVAAMAGRHDTVGRDLVNHCVNDILVQGAAPLFFMDYVGAADLDPDAFVQVVRGLTRACRENGCALLGGETAEMPGLYPPGEYDLVGAIVGAVKRDDLVTGEAIRPGDLLLGLPSTGLHTNGYSLARRIFFEMAGLRVTDVCPGTQRSLADVLLAVHRSYLKPVSALRERVAVRGMAHITGGGLVDNIPRVLPEGIRAVIDQSTWTPPPVFRALRELGGVDEMEMVRVFNMGIGFVIFVRPDDVEAAIEALRAARAAPRVIGFAERGRGGVRFP